MEPVIELSSEVRKISVDHCVDRRGETVLDLMFQVRDPEGHITYEHNEEGHSFLANFIKLLYCCAMANDVPSVGGSTLTLTDTGGTARTGSGNQAHALSESGGCLGQIAFQVNAGSTVDTWGMWVGTDNGTILAKDINNYTLGAQIAHGSGAGQLSYGNSSIVASTHDGSSYSYAGITRSFSNSSGSAIGVNEVGLVTYGYWDTTTNRYFMFSRDILGTTVSVPDGQTLTASVRIKCYS